MHPFRYLNNDAVVTLTGNGTVNNPGTVYSEPVITIEGNGDVSLTIGKQTMQLTIDTKATIDCRHKNKMSMTKWKSEKYIEKKRWFLRNCSRNVWYCGFRYRLKSHNKRKLEV